MLRTGLILLLMLGLAACDSRYRRNYISPLYDAPRVGYAIGGRDLRVDVLGNPFGEPRDDFVRGVTAAMQGHAPGRYVNFTVTPGETARSLYRVVVAFNTAMPVVVSDLCGPPPETVPAARPLEVRMAFCEGGRALSTARGTLEAVESSASPEFRALIGGMTRSLLPRDNPDDWDDERSNVCDFVPLSCN